MNHGPNALRREIAAHNRHCLLAAMVSLLLAWLAWLFFYALFAGAILLFQTILRGEEGFYWFPPWLNLVAAGLALCLLVWGGIDAWRRRYRLPPDRPVIGWHLLPDALLLPARLTFAIGEHLSSRIRLSRYERDEVWRLLEYLADSGRMPVHTLGGEFSDPGIMRRALDALQLLGWIDLHAGEDGWFYRVRSFREEELARLRGIAPADRDEETARTGMGQP